VLDQVLLITGREDHRAVRLLVARARRDARVATLLMERAALRETIQRVLDRAEADRVRP
jgi:hypothetical protein